MLMRKAMGMVGVEVETPQDNLPNEKKKPLNEHRIRLLILAIWIAAVVLSLPTGLFHALDEDEFDHTVRCLPTYGDTQWWKAYNVKMIVLTYFVPMFILDTAYILIAFKIWTTTTAITEELMAATDKNAIEAGNRKKSMSSCKSSRQLMKMLIIVVALFSLCWFPLESYLLFNEIFPEINLWYYINVFFFCSHWLAMSNSCLNPIIYGLYNDKYNKEYKKVFAGFWSYCVKKRKHETPDSSENFVTEYPPCTLIYKETTGTGAHPSYSETFQIAPPPPNPAPPRARTPTGRPTVL